VKYDLRLGLVVLWSKPRLIKTLVLNNSSLYCYYKGSKDCRFVLLYYMSRLWQLSAALTDGPVKHQSI
jgi:hypothetical protein